jgi:hypothetical protein
MFVETLFTLFLNKFSHAYSQQRKDGKNKMSSDFCDEVIDYYEDDVFGNPSIAYECKPLNDTLKQFNKFCTINQSSLNLTSACEQLAVENDLVDNNGQTYNVLRRDTFAQWPNTLVEQGGLANWGDTTITIPQTITDSELNA